MKRSVTLFALCSSLLLQACIGETTTIAQLGDWTVHSEFEGIARNAAVTFTIGNIAYLGTGVDASGQSLRDFWQYDPTTNSWSQRANFPGKARSEAVAFSVGPKGYIGTGVDGSSGTLLRDFYQYDPVVNTWKQVADFGGSARRSAVAFSSGAMGFVTTGFDGQEQRDLWAYDPSTDAWIRKADFGGSARLGAATFVINNLAYVGTGLTNAVYQTDFWSYDPTKNTWTKRQPVPDEGASVGYGVSFAVNGIGYLVPGGDTRLFAYNPDLDSWTTTASFEGAARSKAVGFAIGSKGYVSLGTRGTTSFDDLWAFDPGL